MFQPLFPSHDRVWTYKEYDSLIAAAAESKLLILRDFIEFLYCTGARYSEAMNLLRDDVDFEKKVGTFRDTKNGWGSWLGNSIKSLKIKSLDSAAAAIKESYSLYVKTRSLSLSTFSNVTSSKGDCAGKLIDHFFLAVVHIWCNSCTYILIVSQSRSRIE